MYTEANMNTSQSMTADTSCQNTGMMKSGSSGERFPLCAASHFNADKVHENTAPMKPSAISGRLVFEPIVDCLQDRAWAAALHRRSQSRRGDISRTNLSPAYPLACVKSQRTPSPPFSVTCARRHHHIKPPSLSAHPCKLSLAPTAYGGVTAMVFYLYIIQNIAAMPLAEIRLEGPYNCYHNKRP